jgi:hypothetical protein
VTFTLTYNASLLTILGSVFGAASDANDPAATLALISNTGGVATFHYADTNPLSATPLNPLVLGDVMAVVPSGAGVAALNLYQAKELLQLGNIVINQGAVTGAVSANGVHINAYFSDVSGDGKISGLDALAEDNVAQGHGTGFSAYEQLDPVIIGDVAGDNSVDAGDVSTIDAYVAKLAPFQIPVLPTQLLPSNPNYVNPNSIHSPNAADPTLGLVTCGLATAGPSSIVDVAVTIDHPHPTGSTGLTEVTLALTYDLKMLDVSPSDITLGSIPCQGTGWQISTVVDQTTGQIGIEIYSLTPITATQAGSLVNIAFHTLPDVMGLTTAVQLLGQTTPNGQWFGTGVADSQGAMILSPGIDQLLLPTGSEIISSAISTSPANTETTGQVNLKILIDTLVPHDSQEAVQTTSHLVSSEGETETPNTNLGSGPVGEVTGLIFSAGSLATGTLGFQAKMAIPAVDQMFQMGILPVLNILLYRNSPAQLATERFFQALAYSADTPHDFGLLSQPFNRMIWNENSGLDWLPSASQVPAVGAETDQCVGTINQKGTNQQSVEERNAEMDLAIADLENYSNDFSDLSGY